MSIKSSIKIASIDTLKKLCISCKQKKLLSEFPTHKNETYGKRHICRDCYNKYQNQWYKENRDKHKARTKKSNANRKKVVRGQIASILLENPCIDCGESDIRVLEFDHISGKKVSSIATLIGESRSWAIIEAELSKCVIRCANCHRIKTAKDFNWYKNNPTHLNDVDLYINIFGF